MGTATAAQIVTQGCKKGGRLGLDTLGLEWLNNFLVSQYHAWPWPFLQERASGQALSAGSSGINVGGGSGSPAITNLIQRIHDPIYVYTTDKRSRTVARIRPLTGGAVDMDESVLDTTRDRGIPSHFKMRKASGVGVQLGVWQLIPYPFPDKDYVIAFDYIFVPPAVVAADVPMYPNDETMVQAILCENLRYNKRYEELSYEESNLANMKVSDRMKFGEVLGTNDQIGLDPNTYR